MSDAPDTPPAKPSVLVEVVQAMKELIPPVALGGARSGRAVLPQPPARGRKPGQFLRSRPLSMLPCRSVFDECRS